MKISNIFEKTGKYFGNTIKPKCQYCEFGNRTKDGKKILCEKVGMVNFDYSCSKFEYSPLKRIPIKQLEIPGNINEDYI